MNNKRIRILKNYVKSTAKQIMCSARGMSADRQAVHHAKQAIFYISSNDPKWQRMGVLIAMKEVRLALRWMNE